jgi:UDP-N-acetylmuramate-alanine ligase
MLEAHPWRRVAWLPHRRDVVDFLARELTEGDVCVTLGAGDLTLVPDEVIDRLSGASPGAT